MCKQEIGNFFCLNGDIWKIKLQKCLLSSPLLFIRLVQNAEFDWLPGRQKGLTFVKMLKNLLRNHKVEKADTLHTCL